MARWTRAAVPHGDTRSIDWGMIGARERMALGEVQVNQELMAIFAATIVGTISLGAFMFALILWLDGRFRKNTAALRDELKARERRLRDELKARERRLRDAILGLDRRTARRLGCWWSINPRSAGVTGGCACVWLQYCCRIWERDRRRNPAETELRPIVTGRRHH